MLSLGPPTKKAGERASIVYRADYQYLILFDTRTFEPQRQWCSRKLPSQSGFLVISKHFTATPRIPPASRTLKWTSSRCKSDVERLHFTTRLIHGLRSL